MDFGFAKLALLLLLLSLSTDAWPHRRRQHWPPRPAKSRRDPSLCTRDTSFKWDHHSMCDQVLNISCASDIDAMKEIYLKFERHLYMYCCEINLITQELIDGNSLLACARAAVAHSGDADSVMSEKQRSANARKLNGIRAKYMLTLRAFFDTESTLKDLADFMERDEIEDAVEVLNGMSNEQLVAAERYIRQANGLLKEHPTWAEPTNESY